MSLKVAVLYSGGKDSTLALYECLKRGWEVKTLIAVKPRSDEAFLWHFAAVEWTLLSTCALGIPLFLLDCDSTKPEQEAKQLRKVLRKVKRLGVEALVLGGTGLQRQQIQHVEKVAKEFGMKVLLPHQGLDHYSLLEKAVREGFDIRITQVATEGLNEEWLGRKIDLQSLRELKELSEKFGFHVGFEGGCAESFVVDGPIFRKRIEFQDTEKHWDSKSNSGYLEIKNATLVEK